MSISDVAAIFDLIDREVWIVTAAHAGRRGGLVATFVSNASIVTSMPRIVVGIAKTHETWTLIERSEALVVHLIDESQVDLVWRFGLQSSRDVDKFAQLPTRQAPTGSPLLPDALVWLDCRVEDRMDTGDRTIYLCEVVDGCRLRDARPLTLQRLLQLGTPEKRAELCEQFAADAIRDAESIRRWRAKT